MYPDILPLVLHSSSAVQLLLLCYHRRLRMTFRSDRAARASWLVSHCWCMIVVMAIVGWVGSGMEVVVWYACGTRWLVACWSTSRVQDGDTNDTRLHHIPGAQLRVVSNRNWSVFLGSLNTGCHVKVPVRCPCSWFAALHGTPRMLQLLCKMTQKPTSYRNKQPRTSLADTNFIHENHCFIIAPFN